MDIVLNLINVFFKTIRDVIPITVILFGFQLFVLRQPIPNIKDVIIGFFYVLVGLSLFLLGLDMALFELGDSMAKQLTAPSFLFKDGVVPLDVSWTAYKWVYIFSFSLGFSTAIAEPSLLAVAIKANQESGGIIKAPLLRIAASLGVAIGITLGCYRIIVGDHIQNYIVISYIVIIIQTIVTPKFIVPLAYDSGGVTTSTVTVPLVAALGLGLASTIPGRSVLNDGFGLIALACLFPIMTVMAYAQLAWVLNFFSYREKKKFKKADIVDVE